MMGNAKTMEPLTALGGCGTDWRSVTAGYSVKTPGVNYADNQQVYKVGYFFRRKHSSE
jgi:hypothetical protein